MSLSDSVVRSYDDCRISVECPKDQFAIFSVNGFMETKAIHQMLGYSIPYVETYFNYWDFRVESNEEVYFSSHLESVIKYNPLKSFKCRELSCPLVPQES